MCEHDVMPCTAVSYSTRCDISETPRFCAFPHEGDIVAAIAADKVLLINEVGEVGVDALTVDEFASAFQVDVPPTSAKSTTTNPKFAALQMGWSNTDKTSAIEITEPLVGLQSWNSKFCTGPGEYELSATISPDWQKTIVFDPIGQYTCVGVAVGVSTASPWLLL
jgi:hypothetical protein